MGTHSKEIKKRNLSIDIKNRIENVKKEKNELD
jgi:hypothetical protein